MKRLFCVGILSAASAGGAAVLPIFVNDSPLLLPDAGLPTVNTVAFVNQSTITVSPFTINVGFGIGGFGFNTAATLPFETFNTLYYTNELSGTMFGSPGFRFLNTTNGVRRPARWFVNDGEISTSTYLEVRADNIISTGPLDTSESGLIRLSGKTADLSRVRLRAGQAPTSLVSGGGGNNFPQPGQYVNAFGVTDSYWGVGSNGVFLGNGSATPLLGGPMNLNLPNLTTPPHQVEQFFGRRLSTNRVVLPKLFSFAGSEFEAFAYTNTFNGTADLVQVVFVRTNGPDAEFSARATFDPQPFNAQVFGPAQPVVELSKWYFDPSLDAYVTNNIYLSDSMAILTNLSLFRNVGLRSGATRRPNVYELQTSAPFSWPGTPGNLTFTNGLLDLGYASNRVDMSYAAYSATLFTNNITALASPFSLVASSIIPSNQPGRVEVTADQLHLDATRIRAESTVLLRTKDLVGNQLPRLLDAPLVGVDLTSRQPELVISNLSVPTVQRFFGTVCAWSGLWRNQRADPVTGTLRDVVLHVLVVDHNLQSSVPAQTYQFAVTATNLVIADQVNLAPVTQSFFPSTTDPIRGRRFLVNAESLDVRGSLTLPVGSSWAQSNVQRVVNFTNQGAVFISGTAKYGTDRATPYNTIVNTGTNSALSQLARTRVLHNSGSIIARGAQVQLDAGIARFEGPPIALTTNVTSFTTFQSEVTLSNGILVTNFIPVTTSFTNVSYASYGARVESFADLQVSAGSLSLSNAFLLAGGSDPAVVRPGRLIFSVTNSLTDAGLGAPNLWQASGFEMRRRPVVSDLMGTKLVSTMGINQLRTHVWAAQDLGALPVGFSNNLALGVLGLDIHPSNGRAVFRAASGRQALYVDYIEMANGATNFNRAISVHNNLTIYFANANVPVSKLDGAVGGRFRWVPDFAGPRSSTNIYYPSTGKTYTFNVALVQSMDRDSDEDGIPNGVDEEPIRVLEDATLDITIVANKFPQPRAMISWKAFAHSTNIVEFKDTPNASAWRVLTNYVHGPMTAPVHIYDPITGAAPARVYRLRVNPKTNP